MGTNSAGGTEAPEFGREPHSANPPETRPKSAVRFV